MRQDGFMVKSCSGAWCGSAGDSARGTKRIATGRARHYLRIQFFELLGSFTMAQYLSRFDAAVEHPHTGLDLGARDPS